MTRQTTINSTTRKPATKPRRQFAACPHCGGTRFIEEQYPAYLRWTCRIDLDGYATDYSRVPEIDGDPEVLRYVCTGCRAEYGSARAVVRSGDDDDESWA